MSITKPLIRTSEFWVFKSEYSLFDNIKGFYATSNYLMFFILLITCFIFPIIKTLSPLFLQKQNQWLKTINRWAFLDIFIIALIIIIYQSKTGFYKIEILSGVYYFMSFILFNTITTLYDNRPQLTQKNNSI